MDERIKKQLAFSLEIDKVKNILRQTHLSGHGRRENDTEHSWHHVRRSLHRYLRDLQRYGGEGVPYRGSADRGCQGLRGRISRESQTCTGSYEGLSDQGDQRLNYS